MDRRGPACEDDAGGAREVDLAHFEIGPDPAQWRALYPLFIGFVNPRPIALVSTIDAAGNTNLAPFSFYNMVSALPPVVVFGPGLRADGTPKDTLRNLQENGEFVIATVTEAIVSRVVACATELPHDESEFAWSGLTPVPATRVAPPLVAESPVNMECKVRQILRFGSGPGAGNAVFGDIQVVHVDEAILDAKGRVEPLKLRTVGRLGGKWYSTVLSPYELEIPRPDPPPR